MRPRCFCQLVGESGALCACSLGIDTTRWAVIRGAFLIVFYIHIMLRQ